MPAPESLANVITVVLSFVTRLPATSRTVPVTTRLAPEARSVIGALTVTLYAAPWTTSNDRAPVVRPEALASRLTLPASSPVTVFVATPPETVSAPASPVTVPAPETCANVTTVELSLAIVLPAASWTVAVSSRVEPETRSVVAEVSPIWLAAPWTTVKAPRVPVVSPAAVASIVTGPARAPVIVLVATPLVAVALPVPVTVPAPEALANVTTVVLSPVATLPAASRSVAVRTRLAPEVRSVVEPLSWICAAAPGMIVKGRSVPVARPAAVASVLTGPISWAVMVLVATPLTAVALPVPVIVPAPEAFAKATTVELSEVTVLSAASWIVAVSTRFVPEGKSLSDALSTIFAAAPCVTVKAPRVPVARPLAAACIVTEPTSAPVIVLVATPFEAVAVPVPVTVPAPKALLKVTTVELSDVTVLPAASWIVAVSTRFAPDARSAVGPVSAI